MLTPAPKTPKLAWNIVEITSSNRGIAAIRESVRAYDPELQHEEHTHEDNCNRRTITFTPRMTEGSTMQTSQRASAARRSSATTLPGTIDESPTGTTARAGSRADNDLGDDTAPRSNQALLIDATTEAHPQPERSTSTRTSTHSRHRDFTYDDQQDQGATLDATLDATPISSQRSPNTENNSPMNSRRGSSAEADVATPMLETQATQVRPAERTPESHDQIQPINRADYRTHMSALLIITLNLAYGFAMGMGLIKLIANHLTPNQAYRPNDAATTGGLIVGAAAGLYASIPITAEYCQILRRAEHLPRASTMICTSLLAGLAGGVIGLITSISLTSRTDQNQGAYIGISTIAAASWAVLLHLKWIMRATETQEVEGAQTPPRTRESLVIGRRRAITSQNERQAAASPGQEIYGEL